MTAANSLTRLVERTTGRAAVVQPRVPPMFAPETPGVMGNTMIEATQYIQSGKVQTSQPLSQNKNKTGPTLSPEPAAPLFNEPGEIIPLQEDKVDSKPFPTPGQKVLKADAVSKEKPDIKEELPIVHTNISESQASPEPGPVIPGEPVPQVPSVLSVPSMLLVPDWQPVEEEAQSFEPSLKREANPPKQPQVPVGLATKKEEKTGPVQVTIGRVEVRAVLQQPAVPCAPSRRVPAAPKPVLSLDKYLRMRNGGKR